MLFSSGRVASSHTRGRKTPLQTHNGTATRSKPFNSRDIGTSRTKSAEARSARVRTGSVTGTGGGLRSLKGAFQTTALSSRHARRAIQSLYNSRKDL